jgi:alpha-N-arabinofuranosidase
MYTVHHDATLLPINLTCEDYQLGDANVPAVNASASKDAAGRIHVSLCNLNPNKAAEIRCQLEGANVQNVTGRVLTADAMTAHNTFEKPDAVKPAPFSGFGLKDNVLMVTLPPKSVVVLEIQ